MNDVQSVEVSTRVRIARKLAHSRAWEWETLAELAQLGIPWADAFEIMRDRSVEGMPMDLYFTARRIVRSREQLRRRLIERDLSNKPAVIRTSGDPVEHASALIADGMQPFEALLWMCEELAEHGEPPVVLPGEYDQSFWDAVEAAKNGSRHVLAAYFGSLPEQTVELTRTTEGDSIGQIR